MSTKVIRTTLLVIFGLAAFSILHAQEIVHATAGALGGGTSMSSLSIKEPDQSVEVFRINGSSSAPGFDKSLRAKTETVDKLVNAKTNASFITMAILHNSHRRLRTSEARLAISTER